MLPQSPTSSSNEGFPPDLTPDANAGTFGSNYLEIPSARDSRASVNSVNGPKMYPYTRSLSNFALNATERPFSSDLCESMTVWSVSSHATNHIISQSEIDDSTAGYGPHATASGQPTKNGRLSPLLSGKVFTTRIHLPK
jgi:hypothetical protein